GRRKSSGSSLPIMPCQPTIRHLAPSITTRSASGYARCGDVVRRTNLLGNGSTSWPVTFSRNPGFFIHGQALASSLCTRGGSRVPKLGSLGSVRGAVSNDRSYRDWKEAFAH